MMRRRDGDLSRLNHAQEYKLFGCANRDAINRRLYIIAKLRRDKSPSLRVCGIIQIWKQKINIKTYTE
ncbi:hypothetical protein KAI56_01890 [Candidatus Parcubacteria bacterium]|nr:hypothetical protein [Candidatus Parcubacteria bacterium]